MPRKVDGTRLVRTAVTLLLALSLVVVALPPAMPTISANVVAQDDDDDDDAGGGDDGGDDDGGDIDEDDDDNRGHGNDDDGDDDDNPGRGRGNRGGDDDEGGFVTPVPTQTPTQRDVATASPTRGALTPVGPPTDVAGTPVTTGQLLLRLRACPDGTDPAVGADTLGETCRAGEPDADFVLAGRTGLYSGWSRDVTTNDDGNARVRDLDQGTYSLTLDERDWCAAEASAVDDGLIVIDPGETTEVTAYLCGGDTRITPPAGT